MKENENDEPSVTEAELARVSELDALWGSQDATMSQSWAAENELALLCPKIARELAAARAAIKVAREKLADAYAKGRKAQIPDAYYLLDAMEAALAQLNTHTHE